jgi:hypothetical protein
MIRVVLTDAAYDAIASTLPKGAARWPPAEVSEPIMRRAEASQEEVKAPAKFLQA